MNIRFRNYRSPDDYHLVSRFLLENYQPNNRDGNWLEPAWEYMHYHPYLDKTSLHKIGIWEEEGEIAAIVHYEGQPGEAFFQLSPAFRALFPQILDYAEKNLAGISDGGNKFLRVYVNDMDTEFTALVAQRGYNREPGDDRPIAQFVIPDPFPKITLPPGFRMKSMADDCDWGKIHRVLWRGFNHPGNPPLDELEERKAMQTAPNFRHELKIVVEAPDGNFASFCGMWFQPDCGYAYVEPVATDPDYRRSGLGRAAVLEGIRRCRELGATVAYVGSDQQFYHSIGFKTLFKSEAWVKHFPQIK